MPVISPDRAGKHDVFISYSRRDGEFVQKLHDALQAEGQNPWIDWVNIPKGVDWWQCIQSGIESAYTFVFVISPDSVASKVCREELDYAVQFNKRLLPVIWRTPEFDQIPDDLKRINWNSISFDQNFDGALVQLLEGINADLDHIKFHTYLLELALTWDREGRNADMLLRGSSLENAKEWVLLNAAKIPTPTQLQADYITTSQKVEAEQVRAQTKQRFRLIGAVSGLGVLILNVFVFKGLLEEISVLVSSLENNQELDALIVGIRAGEKLNSSGLLRQVINRTEEDLQTRTVTALQQQINNLREINRLEDHSRRVYNVRFSPDGRLLASASQDGTVKLWKENGTLVGTLFGHTAEVVSIAFNPGYEFKDGVKTQLLASGSYDRNIKLWQIATYPDGRIKASLLKTIADAHADKIYSLSSDPGGTMLASASSDGTVKLWNWQGKLLSSFQHGKAGTIVTGVSFSPYNEQIVTAGYDGIVKLWTSRGEYVGKLQHDSPVLSVTYSPDGKVIASGDVNGVLKLWRPDDTNLTLQKHEAAVRRITFNKSGQMFATASDDGTVRLWNRDGTLKYTLRGHQGAVYRVQFSPDGQILATAGADDTIKLWSLDGFLLDSLEGHRDEVLSIDFSPSKRSQPMLASASADSTVRLWRLDSPVKILPHENRVYDVAFRPKDRILASAGQKTIKLWQQDGTLISSINAHAGVISSLSFDAEKGLLVSAGSDVINKRSVNTVKLWRLSGNRPVLVKTLTGHSAPVTTVKFVPKQTLLASASEDGTVRFWRPSSSQPVHVLDAQQGSLTSIAFSPNGQLMVTTSKSVRGNPRLIKLWKLEYRNESIQSRLLKTLETTQFNQDVLDVSFSADGSQFATAEGATIQLWRQDGTRINTLFQGHWQSITSITFSPDGRLMASASRDGDIKLWTTQGALITTLKRHRREVSSLQFSADSKLLSSASYDNRVLLWSLPGSFDQAPLEKLLKQGCASAHDYLSQKKIAPEIRKFCEKNYPYSPIHPDELGAEQLD